MHLVADAGVRGQRQDWATRYDAVRAHTEALAAPLSAEDQTRRLYTNCDHCRLTIPECHTFRLDESFAIPSETSPVVDERRMGAGL